MAFCAWAWVISSLAETRSGLFFAASDKQLSQDKTSWARVKGKKKKEKRTKDVINININRKLNRFIFNIRDLESILYVHSTRNIKISFIYFKKYFLSCPFMILDNKNSKKVPQTHSSKLKSPDEFNSPGLIEFLITFFNPLFPFFSL